jgi:hypothetical protein
MCFHTTILIRWTNDGKTKWHYLDLKIRDHDGLEKKKQTGIKAGIHILDWKKIKYYVFFKPMTPQATRPPALPVFFESGVSPRPKSSSFSWTTTERPIIDVEPVNLITESLKLNFEILPEPPVIFPRISNKYSII